MLLLLLLLRPELCMHHLAELCCADLLWLLWLLRLRGAWERSAGGCAAQATKWRCRCGLLRWLLAWQAHAHGCRLHRGQQPLGLQLGLPEHDGGPCSWQLASLAGPALHTRDADLGLRRLQPRWQLLLAHSRLPDGSWGTPRGQRLLANSGLPDGSWGAPRGQLLLAHSRLPDGGWGTPGWKRCLLRKPVASRQAMRRWQGRPQQQHGRWR